jgi:phage I-like protein
VCSDAKARTYRKELIYVGKFIKDGIEFSIDDALLQHWVETFNEMSKDGIEVPVPIEHTTNPEARRGTVQALELAADSKGRSALFGVIQFRDEEAEKLAASANVSIYVPPNAEVNGKRYVRPLRHLALTDYPAVPDLDNFHTIAASLANPKGDKDMALIDLAKSLGLKPEDGTDDSKIESMIASAFSALKKTVADLKAGGEKKPEEKPKPAFAAGLLNIAKDNRSLKLSALVDSGKITPAVSKALMEHFSTEESLTLALSNESGVDTFDSVVKSLEHNDPVKLGEQTGSQTIRMSHGTDPSPEATALERDAERRAKEAAAN